jgi:hypothetical protein
MQRWDKEHPILRFIANDPTFECIYVGQTGKVWRVNDDRSIYMELRCGHPYTLQPEDRGTLAEAVDSRSKAELERASVEETRDMKAAKVASSKGVVPVQGYDAQVKKFKIDLNFHKQLEVQVEEAKTFFRKLAAQAKEGVDGEVKRIEFISDDGSATVPVGIPDITKTGNRSGIKEETISKAAQLGVALDELGVTELEEHYVLRGAFVKWLEDILNTNYVSKGQKIPEGIEKKQETRLTVEGIHKLEAMAREAKTEHEREAARVLLDGGIKSASVSAK